jgi:hypothetical protein
MNTQFVIPKEQLKELVPPMGGCFVTNRVTVDGCKIGYMYREQPDRPEDSGWRFFCGDESPEYINDSEHISIFAVNTAANYDPDIIPYLETPAPCAFEKVAGSKYQRVADTALAPG